MKRYLALAEAYSGDDHYGKTTYGMIRYGADPVVVVLDSTRAGETVVGVPVVASVAEALPTSRPSRSSASRWPAAGCLRSGAGSSA
ncbi:MAG: hypothetical protein ACRDNG_04785, partial [Gaiellaceae bacterium]